MAADTFFSIQDGAALFVQVNGLMTAICTGDNATAAAKTRVVIKLREKNGISFEYIGGIADGIEGKAREFLYGAKTFLLEIVIKSGF